MRPRSHDRGHFYFAKQSFDHSRDPLRRGRIGPRGIAARGRTRPSALGPWAGRRFIEPFRLPGRVAGRGLRDPGQRADGPRLESVPASTGPAETGALLGAETPSRSPAGGRREAGGGVVLGDADEGGTGPQSGLAARAESRAVGDCSKAEFSPVQKRTAILEAEVA